MSVLFAHLQKKTLNTTTPFVTEYTYAPGTKADATTTLADSIKNNNNLLSYTYDAMGNILTVSNNGTLQNSYTYDSLNQLTSDVDHTTNTHNEYVYDKGGNMTSRTSYVLDENGEKLNKTNNEYGYGMRNWKDVLTMYNGKYIVSDETGNPLTYRDGIGLSWTNGKQLSYVYTGMYPQSKDIAEYTYDDTGLRLEKNTVDGTTKYYYNGDKLVEQQGKDASLHFFYDNDDNVVGFKTNDSTYYYVKNIQNDIIGIVDSTGKEVVSYTYDTWGKPLSTTGEMADTIGSLNPLRYRGYYYDNETGFYYLNSRYYDPVIGRFVNADDVDVLTEEQNSMVQYNLYSYCLNNPVKMVDKDGRFAASAILGTAATFGGSNAWNPVGWAILGTVAAVVVIAVARDVYVYAKSKQGTGRPELKKQGKEGLEKKKQKPSYKKRSGKKPRAQPRPHSPSKKGHRQYKK